MPFSAISRLRDLVSLCALKLRLLAGKPRITRIIAISVGLVAIALYSGTLAGGGEPAEATVDEPPITEADRQHWAYRPLGQAAPPAVSHGDWVKTGVDTFVLARSEAAGLTPGIEADRRTLLRRVSLDLTGLPPTPDEVDAFLEDAAPDAYERQVTRLLASPAHGERGALHWLDLARFAETDGFEHDLLRPDAWRYRDWVIVALNADMPYDQFIRRQLAGDEMDEKDAEIATMFCLAGPDMPDLNDQAERRHDRLNELTSTVGAALLGLQVGCAQCHDHKYDAVSQADFYRLRAVFEPAIPLLKRDQPYTVLHNQVGIPAARLWLRGDHRRPGPEMKPGFPRIASITGSPAGIGEHPRAALADWLFSAAQPLTARIIVNRLWQQHFGRGLFAASSDVGVLNPGPTHPELLDWLATELRTSGWSLKTLHRTIVCSATYRQVSHAGGADEVWKQRLARDSTNELFSRFPRQRLDGETLRDAMLSVSGLLVTARGGPGVRPPLPPELVETLLKGHWTVSPDEADHYRRSVYLFARRNLRYPLFEAFDRPDANASCPRRLPTTTAPQSLVLFNSEFSLHAARHFAGRLLRKSSDPTEQVGWQYRLAFARPPTAAESARMVEFLERQRADLARETRPRDRLALPAGIADAADPLAGAALVDACLALFNASEFLIPD